VKDQSSRLELLPPELFLAGASRLPLRRVVGGDCLQQHDISTSFSESVREQSLGFYYSEHLA
jgi:hypothetical protein